jgi:hypothetical protein
MRQRVVLPAARWAEERARLLRAYVVVDSRGPEEVVRRPREVRREGSCSLLTCSSCSDTCSRVDTYRKQMRQIGIW